LTDFILIRTARNAQRFAFWVTRWK